MQTQNREFPKFAAAAIAAAILACNPICAWDRSIHSGKRCPNTHKVPSNRPSAWMTWQRASNRM